MGIHKRETLQESGMTISRWEDDDTVILDDNGRLERWARSPHFAGYAVIIEGDTFEFISGNVDE